MAAAALVKRCGWLARWWHARQRQLDRELLGPSFAAAAIAHGGGPNLERIAWGLHRHTPGAEHWRCPCAGPEVEELRAALLARCAEGGGDGSAA